MKSLINSQCSSSAPSLLAGALLFVTGCGVGTTTETTSRPDRVEPSEVEATKIESPITAQCRLSTVGLPCDPDGSGAATECEGVCWLDDAALVGCLPLASLNLATTDLNGRICGDVEGRNCGRSCENGECVDKNARLGTACRPRNNSTTCEGVCTLVAGEPTCDEVTVCENVEVATDGCSLQACNFETFEPGCQAYSLDNSVCEASQIPPVVDSGNGPALDASAATDAGGSLAFDVAVDAALAPLPDSGSTSRTDAETTSGTPDTSGAGSSSSVLDAGDASSHTGDGGHDVVIAPRATKVVGGACSTSRGTKQPWFAAVFALVLGATLRRRRG